MTEAGFEQAQVLAGLLVTRPVDAIVTSKYRRSRQSIEPYAALAKLPVRQDPRLNERILSNVPIADWRQVIRDSFADLDLRAPAGESAREVLRRGWAALNALSSGNYRLPLAVTHGNLISLILHSLDSTFGYRGWQSLSNPDVYELWQTECERWSFRRLWTLAD